jgi:hypothetical protein
VGSKPYSSVTAGFLARLGCTRIGSPGIFGVRAMKALFKRLKPEVASERKVPSYQASSTASMERERPLAVLR